jgi:hypothetical protein
MLKCEELVERPREFLALTGLTVAEFKVLLPAFRQATLRRFPSNRTRAGQVRRRQAGGGRPSRLSRATHQLLFILIFQKTNPLQVMLGWLFGLSESRANRWIHRLLPILHDALGDLGHLPARDPVRGVAAIDRKSGGARLAIDGTERRRQRPKDPAIQRAKYSGRKKQHTDKNVVVAHTANRRIAYLSRTYDGRIHDKTVAESEGIRYPAGAILYKDTAFQGYEPPVRTTYQPKKSHGSRASSRRATVCGIAP